jgi:hypothetical protein
MIVDKEQDITEIDCLVGEWLSLFNETKNPIYAWRTYENARILGVCIPKEILQYLDKVAHSLVKIANNPPEAKSRPFDIAQALGLGKKGAGAASPFKDYADRQKARWMAIETFKELSQQSGKEYVIFQTIAERHRTSESTVRRNYKDHLERWEKEAMGLIASNSIEIGKDGKPQMGVAGTADDFGEAVILLSLVERRLNESK